MSSTSVATESVSLATSFAYISAFLNALLIALFDSPLDVLSLLSAVTVNVSLPFLPVAKMTPSFSFVSVVPIFDFNSFASSTVQGVLLPPLLIHFPNRAGTVFS